MLKRILLFIFIFINIFVYSQKNYNLNHISNEVRVIIDSISDSRELFLVECNGFGYNLHDYYLCQEFSKKASLNELLELTNHPNSIVRSFSFYLLSMNDSVDLFPIIINHFNDNVPIRIIENCVIQWVSQNYTVSDFFIELTTCHFYKKHTKLASSQIEFIDSLLIYNSKEKYSRYYALQRVKPVENKYKRIKQIYKRENDGFALVALAKYKKVQDIPIILNSIYRNEQNTFLAISYFPNQAFMPLLRDKVNMLHFDMFTDSEKNFYMALASYKNKEANELLSIILKKIQNTKDLKYNINYILDAVECNIDENYVEIMYELWKYHYITPDIFRFLNTKDSNRTFEFAKESLKDSIVLIDRNYHDNRKDTLLFLMLDLIKKRDSLLGIEIINNQIKNVQFFTFPFFVKEALILKNPTFVQPLLNVLQDDEHREFYDVVIEALVSYNNSEINKKLIEIKNKKVNTIGYDYMNKALIKYSIK